MGWGPKRLPPGPGAAVCSVSRQPLKGQGCSAEPSPVPGVALLVPLCPSVHSLREGLPCSVCVLGYGAWH